MLPQRFLNVFGAFLRRESERPNFDARPSVGPEGKQPPSCRLLEPYQASPVRRACDLFVFSFIVTYTILLPSRLLPSELLSSRLFLTTQFCVFRFTRVNLEGGGSSHWKEREGTGSLTVNC